MLKSLELAGAACKRHALLESVMKALRLGQAVEHGVEVEVVVAVLLDRAVLPVRQTEPRVDVVLGLARLDLEAGVDGRPG